MLSLQLLYPRRSFRPCMASQARTSLSPALGVVSPIGIGQEPFWTALGEGRSGIRRLPICRRPEPAAAHRRRGGRFRPEAIRPAAEEPEGDEPRHPTGLRGGRSGVRRCRTARAAGRPRAAGRRLRGRHDPLRPGRVGRHLSRAAWSTATFDFRRWGHGGRRPSCSRCGC